MNCESILKKNIQLLPKIMIEIQTKEMKKTLNTGEIAIFISKASNVNCIFNEYRICNNLGRHERH